MNYLLAKELKDAGFPMDYQLENFSEFEKRNAYIDINLSTLIDLTSGLTTLRKTAPERGSLNPRWIAEGWPFLMSATTHQTQAIGSTPEEAVARLWLALR